MILSKNLDEISGTAVINLIEARAAESVHLDFKRDIYGFSDDDKKEFLKDISAFANSFGGHLLIGIGEDKGVASEIVPISGIDVDKELLRLENIARTGIDPPIVGLRMRRVPVDGGDAIVIYVPRSFNPPHRVVFKKANRFFSRNSSGVFELSVEELRRLFGQKTTVEDQVKSFVQDRFSMVKANDGPRALPSSLGTFVAHLISMPDFAAGCQVSMDALVEESNGFIPIGASGWSRQINLEGVVYYRVDPVCRGYTQVFRDGSVEATTTSFVVEKEGSRYLSSLRVPEKLLPWLNQTLERMKSMKTSAPILLNFAFFNMREVKLGFSPDMYFEPPPPYARSDLQLPSTVILDYRSDGNYESVLAEQMNFLWNVFGLERCNYFDVAGKWVGLAG